MVLRSDLFLDVALGEVDGEERRLRRQRGLCFPHLDVDALFHLGLDVRRDLLAFLDQGLLVLLSPGLGVLDQPARLRFEVLYLPLHVGKGLACPLQRLPGLLDGPGDLGGTVLEEVPHGLPHEVDERAGDDGEVHQPGEPVAHEGDVLAVAPMRFLGRQEDRRKKGEHRGGQHMMDDRFYLFHDVSLVLRMLYAERPRSLAVMSCDSRSASLRRSALAAPDAAEISALALSSSSEAFARSAEIMSRWASRPCW